MRPIHEDPDPAETWRAPRRSARMPDRGYTRPFVRFELPYPDAMRAAAGPTPRAPRAAPAEPRAAARPRDGTGAAGAAPHLLVLAGAVLWGLAGIFTKDLVVAGVDVYEIAFWRLLFGGGLFALQATARGDLRLASRSDIGPLAGFAVVAVSLHYAAFNVAIERGGVSLVYLILSSVPILVALNSRIFLGERLTLRTIVLGALSALGLLMAAGGGGAGVTVNGASVGAALVMAGTVVTYTVAGKDLLRRYAPSTLSAFVMPFGALALLPVVDFGGKTPEGWFGLVVLAVLPTYAAHLCYQHGLRRLPASRVALLVNVKAVTALVAAALLFGERFTAGGTVGVAVILGVSALAVLPHRSAPAGPARANAPSLDRPPGD